MRSITQLPSCVTVIFNVHSKINVFPLCVHPPHLRLTARLHSCIGSRRPRLFTTWHDCSIGLLAPRPSLSPAPVSSLWRSACATSSWNGCAALNSVFSLGVIKRRKRLCIFAIRHMMLHYFTARLCIVFGFVLQIEGAVRVLCVLQALLARCGPPPRSLMCAPLFVLVFWGHSFCSKPRRLICKAYGRQHL